MMVVIGYGVCMGLGMGLVYGCTIGNSIKFFPDKAGLVGGLTTATYGLGSVILPLIIKGIVNADTVLGTFKVLGIIYLVVICVGAFLIKKAPVGFIHLLQRQALRLRNQRTGSRCSLTLSFGLC